VSPKFLRPFQLKYKASGKSIVSFPYLQLSAVSLSQASGGRYTDFSLPRNSFTDVFATASFIEETI